MKKEVFYTTAGRPLPGTRSAGKQQRPGPADRSHPAVHAAGEPRRGPRRSQPVRPARTSDPRRDRRPPATCSGGCAGSTKRIRSDAGPHEAPHRRCPHTVTLRTSAGGFRAPGSSDGDVGRRTEGHAMRLVAMRGGPSTARDSDGKHRGHPHPVGRPSTATSEPRAAQPDPPSRTAIMITDPAAGAARKGMIL